MSPPNPRSCLQVTSDFTVPGPGGPGKTYPPSRNLSRPLSAKAPGSHRLPHLVWYSKGNTPHTSHWDLTAYHSLSCKGCLEPIPTCPSLHRVAQTPCGTRGGDMICLLSKSFWTMPLAQRVSGSLRTEHMQAAQRARSSSVQSPT